MSAAEIGNLGVISMILRTRGNVIRMLERRGFETAGRSDETIDTIGARMRENRDYIVEEFEGTHVDGQPKTGVLVQVIASNNIRSVATQVMNRFADREEPGDFDEVIFVSMTAPSENNVSKIMKEYATNSKLETPVLASVLPIQLFAFDFEEHVYTKKYTIIPSAQHEDLLKRQDIDRKSKLPTLLVTDPAARYYGCRKGDIIRAEGKSITAGTEVSYKHVV